VYRTDVKVLVKTDS